MWDSCNDGRVVSLASHGELGMPFSPCVVQSSPLDRVLTRGSRGPWELVGYVTTSDPTQSHDRAMRLHAQAVDRRRNRYNYRVVDRNEVPLDVLEEGLWLTEGDAVAVPGQAVPFVVHLYEKFR